MVSYTVDELMAVCIARQVRDGSLVVQGISTPMVAAGLVLAKLTHAPNVYFASAIGQALCSGWTPLGVARIEALWIGQTNFTLGFVDSVTAILPTLKPQEFFRPAQVDPYGNFNNIALGKDYRRPRLRLPGTGGIPEVTTYFDQIYLYVPRHSRAVFVAQLDFLSGMGHTPARTRGAGPRYLVSDLGQFDWAGGRMRLVTHHPGVTVERVQAKTGFALEIAPDAHPTPPPTDEELRLLREVIDPLGVRRLETLSGAARKGLLRQILAQEGAL